MIFSVDNSRLFTPCPCGGISFRSSPFLTWHDCSIVSCIRCGLLRTWPEPDPTVMGQLYSQMSEKYNLSQATDAQRLQLWEQFSIGILDAIEKHRGRPGRLLEIGCNFGDLLHVARARGWDAEGLEINQANARHLVGQGFTVYDKPLERSEDIDDDRYDAVVINQVLEHIHEPNLFLACIKRILKPDGLLFVGVPCFWSPIPLLLQRRSWYALLPNEHVWQFSRASATRLLAAHRFRVVSYTRGWSAFWGTPSLNPKTWVRWLLYRLIAVSKQGDFLNFVAVNMK